jgi:hypothetical protein
MSVASCLSIFLLSDVVFNRVFLLPRSDFDSPLDSNPWSFALQVFDPRPDLA